MTFVIILCAVLAALFFLSFLTRRRFGGLALVLLAGTVLSDLWAGEVTTVLEGAGVSITTPPLGAVVGIGLIVAPVFLCFLGGPQAKAGLPRVAHALFFALFAGSLLVGSLAQLLVVEGPGQVLYDIVLSYKNYILTIGILIAIVDMMSIKMPKIRAKH